MMQRRQDSSRNGKRPNAVGACSSSTPWPPAGGPGPWWTSPSARGWAPRSGLSSPSRSRPGTHPGERRTALLRGARRAGHIPRAPLLPPGNPIPRSVHSGAAPPHPDARQPPGRLPSGPWPEPALDGPALRPHHHRRHPAPGSPTRTRTGPGARPDTPGSAPPARHGRRPGQATPAQGTPATATPSPGPSAQPPQTPKARPHRLAPDRLHPRPPPDRAPVIATHDHPRPGGSGPPHPWFRTASRPGVRSRRAPHHSSDP